MKAVVIYSHSSNNLCMKSFSLLMLSFLFSCSTSKPQSLHECSFPYIKYSDKELKIRETWKSSYFSSISNHNPKDFIYIIHKIDKNYRRRSQIPTDSWSYKILQDPELLSQSLLVSGSIITQDHLATAFAPESRVGFVLSSECNLIGPSYFQDMLSTRPKSLTEAPQVWQDLRTKFPENFSPKDLVTEMRGTPYYNEVTMLGRYPSAPRNKISIEAVLVECSQEKVHLHQGTAALWSGLRSDMEECLEGYAPKNHTIPFLIELSKKYPVLLKAALPSHKYELLNKRNFPSLEF